MKKKTTEQIEEKCDQCNLPLSLCNFAVIYGLKVSNDLQEQRLIAKEIRNEILALLRQEKQEILMDIKNWTKGKPVTKDKLREYLNTKLEERR